MKTTQRILLALTVLSTSCLLFTTLEGSLMAQKPGGQPAGSPTPAPSSTGTAPGNNTDVAGGYIELTRSAIRINRQGIIYEAMDLTEQESKEFWPLYREYQNEVQKVNDKLVALTTDYLKTYGNLSDEQAQQMLKDFLKYQQARLDLQKKYVERFNKVLPARKVARYFQLENKMDAVINFDLAGAVPLAE